MPVSVVAYYPQVHQGTDAFKILSGIPTGKRPLGDLGIDGRTILEWTLKRWVSVQGIGLIRHRIGIIGKPL